jgi:hypothetical protein
MQIYDGATSATLSQIVGALFDREVRVIAGDWRGVQYWVDGSRESSDSTVWIFDPSPMTSEDLLPLAEFMEAAMGEHILNAVDYDEFTDWLKVNGRSAIGEAECVPVVPPQFVSGREDAGNRATASVPTAAYILSSAKTFAAMRKLGLNPGDEFPPNFRDVVSSSTD